MIKIPRTVPWTIETVGNSIKPYYVLIILIYYARDCMLSSLKTIEQLLAWDFWLAV